MNVVTQIVRLSPALAELRVTVEVENAPADADVRGKLHGPVCPGSETIQVAYPLRHIRADDRFTLRAMIPEPNLWSEDRPFEYQGIVELLSNGQRRDSHTFVVKFRFAASSRTADGESHVG